MKKTYARMLIVFSLLILEVFFTACSGDDSIESSSQIDVVSDVVNKEVISDKSAIDSAIQYIYESMEEDRIVATVNGIPLYAADLQILRRQNEISVQNGVTNLESLPISEEQKEQLRETLVIQSEEEILERMIRSKIQVLEAEKRGITVTEEEAYEQAKQEFNLMKQARDSTDEQTRQQASQTWYLVKDYMEKNNLSEEEYLQESSQALRSSLIKNKLMFNVVENSSKKDAETIQQEYDAFLDEIQKNYIVEKF